MREIKFRVWDKEDKNMSIPFDIFDFSQDESGFKWFGNTNVDDKENIVILQFTGLKDKNGKEIFEGDIVKRGSTEIKVVEWIGGNNKDFNGVDICGVFGLEVIGNIYENPELLEDEE